MHLFLCFNLIYGDPKVLAKSVFFEQTNGTIYDLKKLCSLNVFAK